MSQTVRFTQHPAFKGAVVLERPQLARVVLELPQITLLEIPVRTKHCDVLCLCSDKSQRVPGLVLCTTRASEHLRPGVDPDESTGILFPDLRDWDFFTYGPYGKYTIRAVLRPR